MMSLTGAPDTARQRWPYGQFGWHREFSSQWGTRIFLCGGIEIYRRQSGWYREKEKLVPGGGFSFCIQEVR